MSVVIAHEASECRHFSIDTKWVFLDTYSLSKPFNHNTHQGCITHKRSTSWRTYVWLTDDFTGSSNEIMSGAYEITASAPLIPLITMFIRAEGHMRVTEYVQFMYYTSFGVSSKWRSRSRTRSGGPRLLNIHISLMHVTIMFCMSGDRGRHHSLLVMGIWMSWWYWDPYLRHP